MQTRRFAMVSCVVAAASLSGCAHQAQRGSLVVIVRTSEGTLVASGSRLVDNFTGRTEDGVRKLFTAGQFTWFLTGRPIHVAYEEGTSKPVARVDLFRTLRPPTGVTTAEAAVSAMGRAAASSLTQFYRRHGLRLENPGGVEIVVIGVLHGPREIAFARLRATSDGRGVSSETIAVPRLPRLVVVGHDWVYDAIRNGNPQFAPYTSAPLFHRVMYADADPSRDNASRFAEWLIGVTADHEPAVGGPLAMLHIEPHGTRWLRQP